MENFGKKLGSFIGKYGKWMLLGLSGLISIGIGVFEEREQEQYIDEKIEERMKLLTEGTPDDEEEAEEESETESEDEESEEEDEEEA